MSWMMDTDLKAKGMALQGGVFKNVKLAGWMLKRSGTWKPTRKRYFVMEGDRIKYYAALKGEVPDEASLQGEIVLKNSICVYTLASLQELGHGVPAGLTRDSLGKRLADTYSTLLGNSNFQEFPYSFVLRTNAKAYTLWMDSKANMDRWMDNIQKVTQYVKGDAAVPLVEMFGWLGVSGGGSRSQNLMFVDFAGQAVHCYGDSADTTPQVKLALDCSAPARVGKCEGTATSFYVATPAGVYNFEATTDTECDMWIQKLGAGLEAEGAQEGIEKEGWAVKGGVKGVYPVRRYFAASTGSVKVYEDEGLRKVLGEIALPAETKISSRSDENGLHVVIDTPEEYAELTVTTQELKQEWERALNLCVPGSSLM